MNPLSHYQICLLSYRNMNNCICIKKLKKKYANNINYIIDDFSYCFKLTGFYVLFGDSGTGKTTLLNILCGLIDYDEGEIVFNNLKYVKQINKKDISEYIAYITQKNCFVDYLNVYDNLLLCSPNKKEINKLLSAFALYKVKNFYPEELSGGEKQRLALIQALLKHKQIIILDEPTSALDSKNKKIYFQILHKLKQTHLIICSSHDLDILNYCDYVIDFNNLYKYKNNNISLSTINMNESENHNLFTNLYPFIKQQQKYYKNKIDILLIIIFVLNILIMFFCFNTKDKLMKTVQETYGINYLTVYCPINSMECNNLFKINDIIDYSFVYSLNIPLEKRTEGSNGNINFSTNIVTLSIDKELFPFKSKIKYGSYYSNKNDIILGYELAKKYSNNNPNNLIGEKIIIKMPNGLNEFKIVGIFDYFNEIEREYFKYGQVQIESIDNQYFINNRFTEQYIDDAIVGYNEIELNKQVYYVYFKQFNKLYKRYNEFLNNNINDNNIYVSSFPNQYLDIMEQFNTYEVFLYPIFILSIITSLLFYYQTLYIDMKYKNHIFGVYLYYGYTLKNIKDATIKYNIIRILKNYVYSIFIASLIAYLVNIFNSFLKFKPYKIFNYNFLAVMILFIFLIFTSIIMALILSNKINNKGWYQIVKDNGDLI